MVTALESPTSRKILKVFLASPSDVAAERSAAQDVVNNINTVVGRELGWLIELYMWEDTEPGYGRPQERINPMVDTCDLFIGLLWERWGQPTGTHGSGFEEEFERARNRRKNEPRPEIWLVFKHVDPGKLKDPGIQLTKVLEFKKAQAELREVLFKEVRDLEDWKAKLSFWFLTYLIKLASPLALNPPAESARPIPESDSSASDLEISLTSRNPQNIIPQQLVDLPSLLGRVIKSGQLEFSRGDASVLDEFDIVRFFLLASTWLSRRNTGNVLGTHEMNLLYKYREQLQATTAEHAQVIRTMVADSSDVVPGWFWFRQLKKETIDAVLFSLATQDSSDAVRARAMQLITRAGIRLPNNIWDSLPLNDDSQQVRIAAYKYLVSLADEEALALLEQYSVERTADTDLQEARLKALAGVNPAKAAEEILTEKEPTAFDETRILGQCISATTDELLLRGLTTSEWERVRKLCIVELKRRGQLSLEVAKEATTDLSREVRAVAFESLAERGALHDLGNVRSQLEEEEDSSGSRKLSMLYLLSGKQRVEPTADTIILAFYRTLPTEKLLAAVDWFNLDGPLAYQALALDSRKHKFRLVRDDLTGGFSRIKEESYKKVEAELGAQRAQKTLDIFRKYEDFITARFTESALLGLVQSGEPGDAELARAYLSDTDTKLRDAAVRLISKFGTSDDVDKLLEISAQAYGEIRKVAASTALKLTKDPATVAITLTRSNDSDVVATGFTWLFSQDSPEIRQLFVSMLHDESSTNRARAVYYLSRWMTRLELEDALERCLWEETYYYNVVTWLDRILYCPSPLREMLEVELKKDAGAATKTTEMA
jgi:histone H3/H4